jgi:hypothetical protein
MLTGQRRCHHSRAWWFRRAAWSIGFVALRSCLVKQSYFINI